MSEHFGQKQKRGIQCDTATDWRRPVRADLAVDVGSGVEQHLDHGLVAAHAGVHEGGHSLWEGGLQAGLFLQCTFFFETIGDELCFLQDIVDRPPEDRQDVLASLLKSCPSLHTAHWLYVNMEAPPCSKPKLIIHALVLYLLITIYAILLLYISKSRYQGSWNQHRLEKKKPQTKMLLTCLCMIIFWLLKFILC